MLADPPAHKWRADHQRRPRPARLHDLPRPPARPSACWAGGRSRSHPAVRNDARGQAPQPRGAPRRRSRRAAAQRRAALRAPEGALASRSRSSSCACSPGSCCSSLGAVLPRQPARARDARRRPGARLARRARHRAARALRRLPLAHARCSPACPPVAVAARPVLRASVPWLVVVIAAAAVFAAAAGSLLGARTAATAVTCAPLGSARVSEQKRMQLRGLHHVTADLQRPRAHDRVLPRPARPGDRPRRAVRRRPRARATSGSARSTARRARCSASWSTPSCPRAWSASARRTTSRWSSTRRTSRWRGATTCAAGRGVHRRLRPRGVPLDLPARPRRAHRRDRHARAGLRQRRRRGRLASRPAGACEARGQPRLHASSGTAYDRVARQRGRARARRWRSVIEPTVLVSDIGIDARNLRQRVRPQRCWLISRSADRHALGLPRALEHDVGDGRLALSHLPLELGTSQPNPVGLRKRPHVLRGRSCRSCVHETSPQASTHASVVRCAPIEIDTNRLGLPRRT